MGSIPRMQTIDEPLPETDLQDRFQYVAQFMGFGEDDIATIHGADLPLEAKTKAIRAFSKLLWIQNDLIVRHCAA
jgi:hypothetical protein